jgi:hypothetical protein
VTQGGYKPLSREQGAFDVCWEVYRGLREICETGRLSAIDASAFQKNGHKPDRSARAEDFLADFEKAGKAVLENRGKHSRLVLFRMYYLGLAPYENARHFLGLSELTWLRWTEEIREVVGQELVRRKVYPPAGYFGEIEKGELNGR